MGWRSIGNKKGLIRIGAGILLMSFLVGCGSILQEKKVEQGAPTTPTLTKEVSRSDSRYYDFEDIQVPNELTLDTRKSYIFQTGAMKAGVLDLNGYVEIKSLINFFKGSMARDQWQFKGGFQLPKMVLLFEKKNRRAILFIEETTFNTHVEIWVIPTTEA